MIHEKYPEYYPGQDTTTRWKKKVIEKAEIPSKPLPRKLLSLTLIFLIFGFFLSAFIILAQEFLCGKLKDSKDFETIMEVQVLANIPNLKKVKEN